MTQTPLFQVRSRMTGTVWECFNILKASDGLALWYQYRRRDTSDGIERHIDFTPDAIEILEKEAITNEDRQRD